MDFAYDKGGQLDTRILGVPNVPLAPGAVLPPELLVPGSDFLSVTGRQYRASAHLGGQLALSLRDYLTVSSGIEHAIFKGGGFETRYTTIPVTVGYDRQISTRTTVGARVSATHTDYNGPGDVWVITPQATVQTALSDRLTFSGALGLSYSSVDDGLATHHSTGVAADANLCSVRRSRPILRASVDQPANGNRCRTCPKRDLSALTIHERLDANQTIWFSLDANRYSSPTSFVTSQTFSHATYCSGCRGLLAQAR